MSAMYHDQYFRLHHANGRFAAMRYHPKIPAKLHHKIRHQLPQKVCILDLETVRTSFKTPEKSVLAFVGVRIYTLHGDRYYPRKHRCFFPYQTKELETFLKDFQGIVIGHNVLNFDYRVLRPLISLDGVIEKTVDTLAFLYSKNRKEFSGLSLDDLGRVNLRKGKTLKGKFVSELWARGRHKQVIAYNNNDCILTKGLWWHLIRKRYVLIKRMRWQDEFELWYREDRYTSVLRDISLPEIPKLTGKEPMYSFTTWNRRIERFGSILR